MSSVRLIDDQITALRARPLGAVFPKLTHSLKLDTRGSRNMAPSAPRVFISYSHDSLEHARRVMGLAERLRKDGIDAQLDQYVAGTPARGWPRWMEDQLDSSEAEALQLADRTSAEGLVERFEERLWRADLHRLRGVLLTAMGADETQIEASFCEAIRTAREQKSIPLVRRAEASYAEYRSKKQAGQEDLAPPNFRPA